MGKLLFSFSILFYSYEYASQFFQKIQRHQKQVTRMQVKEGCVVQFDYILCIIRNEFKEFTTTDSE
jgi:hypothetical protein